MHASRNQSKRSIVQVLEDDGGSDPRARDYRDSFLDRTSLRLRTYGRLYHSVVLRT